MTRKHKACLPCLHRQADQFHFKFGREDFRLINETCEDHERLAREQARLERDRKQSELNQLTLPAVKTEDKGHDHSR